MQTINGTFPSRSGVEIAVEHLVQEYGIERTDIFIRALDRVSDQAGGAAANDGIEVSVDVHEDEVDAALTAFRDAGATSVTQK
ncbi:MAG: hypothetical protein JWR77_2236 [Rhizorhabdus sp.]|nr:hypothetical protein [Rhizorhabdus sp.]